MFYRDFSSFFLNILSDQLVYTKTIRQLALVVFMRYSQLDCASLTNYLPIQTTWVRCLIVQQNVTYRTIQAYNQQVQNAGSYLVSVKKVCSQNGGFIRATELAPRLLLQLFFKLTRTCLLHKETYQIIFCFCIITGNLLDNSF